MRLLTRMLQLQEAHGAVTDAMLRRLSREERVPLYRLEELRGFYPVFRRAPGPGTRVQVCRDMTCMLRGGADHCARVEGALAGLPGVEVEETSCLGRCDSAPAAMINGVPVSGGPEAIAAYASGKAPLLPEAAPPARTWPTDPYSAPAERYGVLRSLLTGAGRAEARRDRALEELKAARLRGMGGAGFPTGTKWDLTRQAPGTPKYVVCNADESEPGAFKDRLILEELPHLMIEGAILAGWVINAPQGIIYVRHEYGRERRAVRRALEAARAAGVLGRNIFGAGFDFDLTLVVSPGGYIQGEETALLEALEDRRGEPRNRPPFPTQQGLWGKPTLVNNVETLAAVPVILQRGAGWWAAQGRGESTGLKYVSVSGDVAKPGVYCVPMGIPIEELLTRSGGTRDGRPLVAFAPGGASSNFLPAARRDVPLDFRALEQAGSMLGSGAVIYVAEGSDLLVLAVHGVRFFRNESCGKCVPCRLGSQKAAELLELALGGRPVPGLTAVLQELGATLARTSICGLGQVALRPVLSVIENFPDYAAARLSDRSHGGRP